MSMNDERRLPVAVLGAGPVGLAAAAHLIERGLAPLILEAGTTAGANLATYRHVRLFSPWRYNIDKAARHLLQGQGWNAPAEDALPTAGELLDDYLVPLAATPRMAVSLRLGHRVTAITRVGFDKVLAGGVPARAGVCGAPRGLPCVAAGGLRGAAAPPAPPLASPSGLPRRVRHPLSRRTLGARRSPAVSARPLSHARRPLGLALHRSAICV